MTNQQRANALVAAIKATIPFDAEGVLSHTDAFMDSAVSDMITEALTQVYVKGRREAFRECAKRIAEEPEMPGPMPVYVAKKCREVGLEESYRCVLRAAKKILVEWCEQHAQGDEDGRSVLASLD